MDGYTEEQLKEANEVVEFFINLMENSRNVVRYYLCDEIVFDWFGQTVTGEKQVNAFLKSKVSTIKHYFSNAVPTTKIGFRDTHRINSPKRSLKKASHLCLLSPPRITRSMTPKNTPRKKTEASTSSVSSSESKSDCESSPAKKFKPTDVDADSEVLEGENDGDQIKIKYVTAEGCVEFHRPSLKKLQPETKWKRPCKLNIAYSTTSDIRDSTFYMVIYEGNVKCRRNLLKEFEAEEQED